MPNTSASSIQHQKSPQSLIVTKIEGGLRPSTKNSIINEQNLNLEKNKSINYDWKQFAQQQQKNINQHSRVVMPSLNVRKDQKQNFLELIQNRSPISIMNSNLASKNSIYKHQARFLSNQPSPSTRMSQEGRATGFTTAFEGDSITPNTSRFIKYRASYGFTEALKSPNNTENIIQLKLKKQKVKKLQPLNQAEYLDEQNSIQYCKNKQNLNINNEQQCLNNGEFQSQQNQEQKFCYIQSERMAQNEQQNKTNYKNFQQNFLKNPNTARLLANIQKTKITQDFSDSLKNSNILECTKKQEKIGISDTIQQSNPFIFKSKIKTIAHKIQLKQSIENMGKPQTTHINQNKSAQQGGQLNQQCIFDLRIQNEMIAEQTNNVFDNQKYHCSKQSIKKSLLQQEEIIYLSNDEEFPLPQHQAQDDLTEYSIKQPIKNIVITVNKNSISDSQVLKQEVNPNLNLLFYNFNQFQHNSKNKNLEQQKAISKIGRHSQLSQNDSLNNDIVILDKAMNSKDRMFEESHIKKQLIQTGIECLDMNSNRCRQSRQAARVKLVKDQKVLQRLLSPDNETNYNYGQGNFQNINDQNYDKFKKKQKFPEQNQIAASFYNQDIKNQSKNQQIQQEIKLPLIIKKNAIKFTQAFDPLSPSNSNFRNFQQGGNNLLFLKRNSDTNIHLHNNLANKTKSQI